MKKLFIMLFSSLLICIISLSSMSCNLEGVLRRKDRDFQSLKEKGIAAINEKKLEEGVQALESALKIKEDNELKIILDFAQKELQNQQFEKLKEEGLKAVEADKLSDGIKALEAASAIKTDTTVLAALDEAYFERGEYFFNQGKKDEAIADLVKCSAENARARNLLRKFYFLSNIYLASPQNQAKLESTEVSFAWNTVPSAIAYEIHIEDENWKTVYQQINTGTSLTISEGFEYGKVYYWRVRAQFPNNILGDWSKKYWFSLRKPASNEPSTASSGITTTASSKNPPVLMNPIDKARLDTYTFFFIWEVVSKADSYQIQIEDNGGKLTVSRTVKNTQYRTVDELTKDSTYFWRVRAHFPNNTFGNWSEKRSFTVHDESFNRFQAKMQELVVSSKGEIVSITPLYDQNDWSKVKIVVGNHWSALTKEKKEEFAEYHNELINTIAQYYGINDGNVLVVFYDEYGQRVAELSSWGGYNILK